MIPNQVFDSYISAAGLPLDVVTLSSLVRVTRLWAPFYLVTFEPGQGYAPGNVEGQGVPPWIRNPSSTGTDIFSIDPGGKVGPGQSAQFVPSGGFVADFADEQALPGPLRALTQAYRVTFTFVLNGAGSPVGFFSRQLVESAVNLAPVEWLTRINFDGMLFLFDATGAAAFTSAPGLIQDAAVNTLQVIVDGSGILFPASHAQLLLNNVIVFDGNMPTDTGAPMTRFSLLNLNFFGPPNPLADAIGFGMATIEVYDPGAVATLTLFDGETTDPVSAAWVASLASFGGFGPGFVVGASVDLQGSVDAVHWFPIISLPGDVGGFNQISGIAIGVNWIRFTASLPADPTHEGVTLSLQEIPRT